MRTIGLIGGMSWQSSADYYRLVNEAVAERLGGFHSAKTLMASVDFAEVEDMQRREAWDEAAQLLLETGRGLERAGAELIILCTNTMHRVADELEDGLGVPFLHIADPTGTAIRAAGIDTVGLLGTRFTMEQAFYVDRLSERHGVTAIVPDEAGRKRVHDVIYEELVHGRVEPESRTAFAEIIGELVERGARGIVLGCTEIGLLVGPDDAEVPVFDTTRLHAEAAVDLSLA